MPESPYQKKFYAMLAREYPTLQSLYTEIINLQAILNLPKGTEHFISDIHGEHKAFEQILNNCSGVIRNKVFQYFYREMPKEQLLEFCRLICYPADSLEKMNQQGSTSIVLYRNTLKYLIRLAKYLSSKYTRSKVRNAMSPEFAFIMDELMHAQDDEDENQQAYHEKIIDTLIEIGSGNEIILSLCNLIKRLAVNTLHILGDIFDRGPRPDAIMEMLLSYHSVDLTWGNHDILWMGAASGNRACIAAAVRNCFAYGNTDMLENGYGISMRQLSLCAEKAYPSLSAEEASLKMITLILLKQEGELIRRHPEYELGHRLTLEKINRKDHTVRIQGHAYPISFSDLLLSEEDPYRLSLGEQAVTDSLCEAFTHSERLHRHVEFLYAKGSMYRCVNGNLLYHGCIPMQEDGSLRRVVLNGTAYSGKAYLDFCDGMARSSYFIKRQDAVDFMWFLWCADISPLCGRRVKTFERFMIDDPSTWHENRDPYYEWVLKEDTCRMLLAEFGLSKETGHIINGHTPVLLPKGETPVRAGGYLFVIDGGFCKACQPNTGIAGYTLISNSHGFRLVAHRSMDHNQQTAERNEDITSSEAVSVPFPGRQMVKDTDDGKDIQKRIDDLTFLLHLYQQGEIAYEVH